MAKSAKSAHPSGLDAALLDGLRKALAGPKPLLGKDALFPAKLKDTAQAALDQGYLSARTETIRPATKTGKAKEVVLAELTEMGRRVLLEADSPRALLESLLPAVQELTIRRTASPSADAFRAALEKATKACTAAIQDGLGKLQKSVEAAFTKLEQAVVKALPAPTAGPTLDPTPVLTALHAALLRLTASATAGISSSAPPPRFSPPTSPAPIAESPMIPASTVTADELRTVLRASYDELRLYKEFQDGLVEMRRLYHEASRRLPGLPVDRFHRELEALGSERKIELHKLNEVYLAKERHLAIERDDRLYYYVLWK